MGLRFEKLYKINGVFDKIVEPASVEKYLKPNIEWGEKKEDEFRKLIDIIFLSVSEYEKVVGFAFVEEELNQFISKIKRDYSREIIFMNGNYDSEKFDKYFWNHFQKTYLDKLEQEINSYLDPLKFSTDPIIPSSKKKTTISPKGNSKKGSKLIKRPGSDQMWDKLNTMLYDEGYIEGEILSGKPAEWIYKPSSRGLIALRILIEEMIKWRCGDKSFFENHKRTTSATLDFMIDNFYIDGSAIDRESLEFTSREFNWTKDFSDKIKSEFKLVC